MKGKKDWHRDKEKAACSSSLMDLVQGEGRTKRVGVGAK